VAAASHAAPVATLTHRYYRYPARFSEVFAREAILHFSRMGDVILDPFVGGGTTAVEAIANGRRAIGTDISELSVFVAKAKTTILGVRRQKQFADWAEKTVRTFDLRRRPIDDAQAADLMPGVPWQLRRAVAHLRARLPNTASPDVRLFATCVVLRTAQWALDNRMATPSQTKFVQRFLEFAREACANSVDLEGRLNSHGYTRRDLRKLRLVLRTSADAIGKFRRIQSFGVPKLVVTSPPYPGVHVLYNRWQVQGRKETALPFWLTGAADGKGAAHYTFVDRRAKNKDKYFDGIARSFSSVSCLLEPGAPVIQLVSFADALVQFPRYLQAMVNAGFEPCEAFAREYDAAHWRTVPGRRWYAYLNDSRSSAGSEVLLVHRKRGK
jgi:DNA modification methylase